MPSDQRQAFLDVVKQFNTAMLLTEAKEGGIHARPMAVAAIEPDGRAFFATSIEAAKVHEISSDSRVTVTYQSTSRFATMSGNADIVTDRSEIDRLWSESWRVWWPAGKDDPSLALIRVTPHVGEYWDNAGMEGVKYAFKAVQAMVQGKRPSVDQDQHGKVAF